jgi:hypothetical protein
MSNPKLMRLRDEIQLTLNRTYSPFWQHRLKHFLQLLDEGIDLSEREIEDALSGALRGSEFPGDRVGRPRDDFDE